MLRLSRLVFAIVPVVGAFPPSSGPVCSVPVGKGKVYNLTINDKPRCFASVLPQSDGPRPVLLFQHGHTGNARSCGYGHYKTLTGEFMGDATIRNNFILICTEAIQVPNMGGSWQIPRVFNSTTGSNCDSGATDDTHYMKAVIEKLKLEPDVYDTSKIFIHGSSQGAGFSTYATSCVREMYGDAISAWGAHSTGLKDADVPDVHLPGNSGECATCEFWPFYPGVKKTSPPLKACVLDNRDDVIPSSSTIPESSEELVRKWKALGNNAKLIMYDTGGHGGTHSWDELFSCLDDGTGRLLGSGTPSLQI